MKKLALAGLMIVTGCAGHSATRDGLRMANPPGTVTFLERIVGEWEYKAEALSGPDQPPQRFRGTEHGRMVGTWAVLETHGESAGGPFTGILTVGAGAGAKQYVGTWISSVSDTLVQYQGSMDEAGRVLTLEAMGPAPGDPAKQTRYRDIIELLGDDRKTFTSMMEMDGKWITYLTGYYQRPRGSQGH